MRYTNSCATGRSAVWQRTWFGTKGSQVQILPPRPYFKPRVNLIYPRFFYVKSFIENSLMKSQLNKIIKFDSTY